eukprot:6812468-Pyramimonas_sp.AAC.1
MHLRYCMPSRPPRACHPASKVLGGECGGPGWRDQGRHPPRCHAQPEPVFRHSRTEWPPPGHFSQPEIVAEGPTIMGQRSALGASSKATATPNATTSTTIPSTTIVI